MLEHFTWGKLINTNYQNLSHPDYQIAYGDYEILTISNLSFLERSKEIAESIAGDLRKEEGFKTELSYLLKFSSELFIYPHFYPVYKDYLRSDICWSPFHCFVFDKEELIKMDYKPWSLSKFFCKSINKNQITGYDGKEVLIWKDNFKFPQTYAIPVSDYGKPGDSLVQGKLSKEGIWNITNVVSPGTVLNNLDAFIRYSLICEGIAFDFNDDFNSPPHFLKLRFCKTANPAEGNRHRPEELASIKVKTVQPEVKKQEIKEPELPNPLGVDDGGTSKIEEIEKPSEEISHLNTQINNLNNELLASRNKISDLEKLQKEKAVVVANIKTNRFKKLIIALILLVVMSGIIFFFVGKSTVPTSIATTEVDKLKDSLNDLVNAAKKDKQTIKQLMLSITGDELKTFKQIDSLTGVIETSNKLYEEQRNKTQSLIVTNNQLQATYNTKSKAYDDLNAKYKVLDKNYNNSVTENQSLNTAKIGLSTEKTSLSTKLNTLNKEIERLRKDSIAAGDKIKALETQIVNYKKPEAIKQSNATQDNNRRRRGNKQKNQQPASEDSKAQDPADTTKKSPE